MGEVDIRTAIEAINFAEFGGAEVQKVLREVLLEYLEVSGRTTSILSGPDFSFELQDGAGISWLNPVAFHKSPLETKVEEVDIENSRSDTEKTYEGQSQSSTEG
jgi:hypothetical protein